MARCVNEKVGEKAEGDREKHPAPTRSKQKLRIQKEEKKKKGPNLRALGKVRRVMFREFALTGEGKITRHWKRPASAGNKDKRNLS